MTFAMCRNAVNGERFLEMSKLQQLTGSKITKTGLSEMSNILASKTESKLPPLMRAGKELTFEDNEMVKSLLGSMPKKSKKEE